MALIFFEEVLALRLGEPAFNAADPSAIRSITEESGFLGDLKSKNFQAVGDVAPNYRTAWLPTLRVARAWQALVTEKPFDR